MLLAATSALLEERLEGCLVVEGHGAEARSLEVEVKLHVLFGQGTVKLGLVKIFAFGTGIIRRLGVFKRYLFRFGSRGVFGFRFADRFSELWCGLSGRDLWLKSCDRRRHLGLLNGDFLGRSDSTRRLAANLANDRKDLTVLLYRVNLCVVVTRAEVLLLARTVRQGTLLIELLWGKNSFSPAALRPK